MGRYYVLTYVHSWESSETQCVSGVNQYDVRVAWPLARAWWSGHCQIVIITLQLKFCHEYLVHLGSSFGILFICYSYIKLVYIG